MQRPTPDLVRSYALSIGYDLDGEHFCDFYEQKGWKAGKVPMVDWKAAVRTWKRMSHPDLREQERRTAQRRTVALPKYVEHRPSEDELMDASDFKKMREALRESKRAIAGPIQEEREHPDFESDIADDISCRVPGEDDGIETSGLPD